MYTGPEPMNYDNLSDEQLVLLVRARGQELFRILVLRYQDKLMRYARYLSRDDMLAADIVQEVFIKVFININSFAADRKFSSWIYRITHNEAISQLRKSSRERTIDIGKLQIPNKINHEEDFDKITTIKSVEAAITTMPHQYSEPFILYFFENKDYEDISNILQIPIGTVASRINRAKLYIRKNEKR